MKSLLVCLAAGFLPAGSAFAAVLLTDNFNAPDNENFDNSAQDGRRGGLLGPDVQLRSSRFQHAISGNELLLGIPASGGSGRVRFHDVANLGDWHDFASGPGGAAILADGGFRIEFDWTPAVVDNTNWVSISVGIAGQAAGEPGIRVNHADTDFGILFRNNGGTQYFDNGAATTGVDLPAPAAPRHILVEYRFGSFDDGTPVSVSAYVDGSEVIRNLPFQWEGNGGVLNIEFGSNQPGSRIDNFQLSTVPEPSAALLTALTGALAAGRRRAAPPATC